MAESNNIWIRANAGSGKTTRLITRYKELLDSGVKSCQILCITYTNAAALEMKNRIKRERTDLQDKDLKIMTIHSFCQDLLIKHNLLKKDTSIINSDYRQKSKLANRITHQLKDDESIAGYKCKVCQIRPKQVFHDIQKLQANFSSYLQEIPKVLRLEHLTYKQEKQSVAIQA